MPKPKEILSKEFINQYLPIDFDWEYYLNAHPDLLKANINTQYEAQKHYINYGIREKRKYNDGLEYLCPHHHIKDKTITNHFLDNKELDYVNFGGFLISCANLAQMCVKYKWNFSIDYSQSIIFDYISDCNKILDSTQNKNIIDFDDISSSVHDFESKRKLLENIISTDNGSLNISTSFSTLNELVRYHVPKIKLCDQTKILLRANMSFGKKVNNKFSKFQLCCDNYSVLFISKKISRKNPDQILDSIMHTYNTHAAISPEIFPKKLLIVAEDYLFFRLFHKLFKSIKCKNKQNIIFPNQTVNMNYDSFVFGLLLDFKVMTQCKEIYYFAENEDEIKDCGVPIFISSVYDKELIRI